MSTFDRLERGVHFEASKTRDPFHRVWHVYTCLTCDESVTRASALHADMSIREHILTHHQNTRPRSLTVLGDYLGEPPC